MLYLVRIASRGGAAAILVLLFGLLVVTPQPARAQDEVPVAESSGIVWDTFTVLIAAVAAACLVCFAMGVTTAKRKGAWPHWRALLLGTGEAAFLLGIIGTFQGMAEAFRVVAMLGASVTPSDVADGYARCMTTLIFGAWVALAALLGAGILAWLQPPRREVDLAETFS